MIIMTIAYKKEASERKKEAPRTKLATKLAKTPHSLAANIKRDHSSMLVLSFTGLLSGFVCMPQASASDCRNKTYVPKHHHHIIIDHMYYQSWSGQFFIVIQRYLSWCDWFWSIASDRLIVWSIDCLIDWLMSDRLMSDLVQVTWLCVWQLF